MYNNISEIVNSDLYIANIILQHWDTNKVINFLDEIIRLQKCKYILICNCSTQNEDGYDNVEGGLSVIFYPLNIYNPEIVLKYNTKEVSLITVEMKT